jgi:hypothetical protein
MTENWKRPYFCTQPSKVMGASYTAGCKNRAVSNFRSSSVIIPLVAIVYLQDDESLDDCHDSHRGEKNNDDEVNVWLVKSTVDSDCIDFGSLVHHQDEFPDELFYNPYNMMLMPRVKELESIVAASKNCHERGVAVEQALDRLFLMKRQTWHQKLVELFLHALLGK